MQKTLLLFVIFLWATDLIAQDSFHKKGFELDIDLMAPLGEYKGLGGLARFDFWQVDRNWGSTKSALRFIVAQQSYTDKGFYFYTIPGSPAPSTTLYNYDQKYVLMDLAIGIEQQFYFNRSRLYFGGDFYFYRESFFENSRTTITGGAGTIPTITTSNLIDHGIYTGMAPYVGYSFFIQKWLCIGTELSLPISFSYANKSNTGNDYQYFEFDIWPRTSRLLYIGFHF
jgi:hypothetical protein